MSRLKPQLSHGVPKPGDGSALDDASQYFAIAKIEGKDKALAWRCQRLTSLQVELQRLKSDVLPKATAHDTLVVGGAVVGGYTG